MTDRLAEIAERERKATPGPWIESCGRNEFAVVTEAVRYPSEHQVRYGGHPIADCEFYDSAEAARNCDFICEARADIPWLLANTNSALSFIAKLRDQYSPREVPIGAINMIEAILRGESDGSEWPQTKQEPNDGH